MIEKHPPEEVLQEFTLGENVSEAISEHIRHCVQCQARVSGYQLMFSKLKMQEKAVFDFNVSELVLPRIQPEPSKPALDKWLIYLAIFSAIGLSGGILYVFAESIRELFAGFTRVVLCLVIITAFAILLFQCFDVYNRYQKKIKALDII